MYRIIRFEISLCFRESIICLKILNPKFQLCSLRLEAIGHYLILNYIRWMAGHLDWEATQSPIIKEGYCLFHLATGDMVRAAVAAKNPYWHQVLSLYFWGLVSWTACFGDYNIKLGLAGRTCISDDLVLRWDNWWSNTEPLLPKRFHFGWFSQEPSFKRKKVVHFSLFFCHVIS